MLNSGERQVAPTLAGIRRDHVARYEWARSMVDARTPVIDAASGCGYGTQILSDVASSLFGFDNDRESVQYAKEHYPAKGAMYVCTNLEKVVTFNEPVQLISFETLEHLSNPESLLMMPGAESLLASVPNEDVFPYASLNDKGFHKRHYTVAQFGSLLAKCGWSMVKWWTQLDRDGVAAEVIAGTHGHTIIAQAVRL